MLSCYAPQLLIFATHLIPFISKTHLSLIAYSHKNPTFALSTPLPFAFSAPPALTMLKVLPHSVSSFIHSCFSCIFLVYANLMPTFYYLLNLNWHISDGLKQLVGFVVWNALMILTHVYFKLDNQLLA